MVALACSASARATDYSWNFPGSGTFNNAINWSPFNPGGGALGPGGAGDTVNFDLGFPPVARYTVIGVAGQNNRLLVHNDSLTLQISSGPSAVDYGLLNANSATPSFTVGLAAGDMGDVLLTGAAGALLSTEFTSIGHAADSTGLVTVDGLQWSNGSSLTVGEFGDGALTIPNGGSVSNGNGRIGVNAGSNGTVTVAGTGSTWSNGSALEVGVAGAGTLTIEAGGSVSSISGYLGADLGSTGTISVSGADSTWTVTDILDVGRNGVGALTIEAGGSVSNGQGAIGHFPGSAGMVSVTGADSSWVTSGLLFVGFSSPGTLMIEAGGRVSNTQGAIGHFSGSTGTVSVTGAGSTWVNSGALQVGDAGAGTLAIEADGSVSNTNGRIGVATGSIGAVAVSGAGSNWINSGNLTVGVLGAGMLTVNGGGTVSSSHGALGFGAGGVGTATVAGAGSMWTMTAKLSIGGDAISGVDGGAGTLRIQSGGAVRVSGDTVLFSDGLLKLEGGSYSASAVVFQGGGEFQWTSGRLSVGVYNGSLTTPSGGVLAPGASAGSTTIVGDYTHQGGAKLEIEIGGTSAGSAHDLVSITGSALFGGQLELNMLNGFVPSAANAFTVLNAAGGLFGVFSNVITGQRLATADGVGSFVVNYGTGSAFNQNQIVLSNFQLNLTADFDGDGDVDGDDLAEWRNDFGAGNGSDADGDNDSDGHDFLAWQRQLGSVPAVAATAVVPEPGAFLLFILASAGFRRTAGRKC
jgi:fibronectin-binding autotransporter adhesin